MLMHNTSIVSVDLIGVKWFVCEREEAFTVNDMEKLPSMIYDGGQRGLEV